MLDAVWFFCAFKQFRDVLRVEWFIIYLFVNLLIDDVAHTNVSYKTVTNNSTKNTTKKHAR